ncbi:MAG: hypothetical protein AAF840_11105 [Bacteroidota bacterium]
MKLLLAGLLYLLLSLPLLSQESYLGAKSISFELGGVGGVASLNYERVFLERKRYALAGRVGLSFAPVDRNNGTAIIIPVLVEALIGRSRSRLELGVGQGFTVTTKGNPFALTIASVGYRFQGNNSRFYYRIAYTPLVSYLIDFQVQHWGGIGIGYRLKN